MLPNENQSEPPEAETEEKDLFSLLIECAVESFTEGLMAFIWGKIVFGLVGGFVGNMIPSLPPGVAGAAPPNQHPAAGGRNWFASNEHFFWIVFALFFAVNLISRIRGAAPGVTRETRLHRIARRLREEGLSLLFQNAVGAMIGAWVASLATNWSWSHWLFEAFAPTLHRWADQVFGGAGIGAVQEWWGWWSANQLKFSFWLLYITAICDDLGVPNLKTLARFFWRRWRNRSPQTSPGLAANTSD